MTITDCWGREWYCDEDSDSDVKFDDGYDREGHNVRALVKTYHWNRFWVLHIEIVEADEEAAQNEGSPLGTAYICYDAGYAWSETSNFEKELDQLTLRELKEQDED